MTQKQIFAIRLPKTVIKELEDIADAQYIPTRTMIRGWIMKRLETERIEPVPSAEVGATALGTDGHRTHGAGVDGTGI